MALIPFDYAATFQLVGEPGRVHEDVISISPESPFVAYAVSYGLEEERSRPLALSGLPPEPFLAGDVTLEQLPEAALIDGFRFNPRERVPAAAPGAGAAVEASLFDREYTAATAPRLLQRVKPPEEASFLFSLIDTASGRELQDEPANNLASLGKSTGSRPFRLLARPLHFQPRSTIRVQIIERSQNVRGVLFIVLQGYKQLGGSSGPRPAARPPRATRLRAGPRARGMVPFDYVVSLDLDGVPGNIATEEVTISVDGAFIATHIGYGLESGPGRSIPVNPPAGDDTDLGDLALRSFPEAALADGIRIRPEYHRIALNPGGALATVRRGLVGQIFESLNRPEDVQFRYAIFDGGRGRDLQDRPLFNLAGLGTADGDRPFKRFPSPLVFLPRSTLRISVEERFGRGTLYFALQGYKTSAPARRSSRP